MSVTAQTPLLVAAEVLGDQLQVQLGVLAKALPPHVERIGRRFETRLRRLGYNPLERRALAAITPGAAASMLASQRLPPDFIEQVEYNGRRLAKLNLAPARITCALKEYNQLLAGPISRLEADEGAKVRRALEEWQFCVALTLNNAFHQVTENETHTCHELFRNELESKTTNELLSALLESLVRFCRAEAGAIFFRDHQSRQWVLRAATESPPHGCGLTPGAMVPAADGGRMNRPRCSVRKTGKLILALNPAWRDQYRACWSFPLLREGRCAGVIQFAFAKPYHWLPREVEVLSLAAERCLLAVQKARLVEDLAARETEVRELANRMVQVEERERRRISSELHDEAGQSLLCVRLQLEMLEREVPETCASLRSGLAGAREITESTIVEIRRLISALSPSALEQLGLAPALRQLASRMESLHRVRVGLHLGSLAGLSKPLEIAVYRLAQECLNNVIRHSGASRVNIRADSADGHLRLYVKDDGVGFCVADMLGKSGSFGLAGMRERVALLGGAFDVTSREGRGTEVSIRLPIREGTGS